jgi:hypothetical protein
MNFASLGSSGREFRKERIPGSELLIMGCEAAERG